MSQPAYPPNLLTPTQKRVLDYRRAGHSWRTIALALKLDEATVRGHHRRAQARIDKHRQEAT